MRKARLFLGWALAGALVGWAIDYLLGPADERPQDAHYRSRLDHALEEGQRAATEREAELRRQFQQFKGPGAA
jgi:hypothetical protein